MSDRGFTDEPNSEELSQLGGPVADLAAGDLLVGRYEIVARVGRGASGAVYKVLDRVLPGRPVALKVFGPQYSGNPAARSRIARELLIGMQLEDPQLVKIYDLVMTDTLLGYTMEWIDGTSFAQIKAEDHSLAELLTFIERAAYAVLALHRFGLVHRDLKPENIMLREDGSVVLIDLGLTCNNVAGARDGFVRPRSGSHWISSGELTNHGDVVGTPLYVAPEYIEFGSCDSRADLYALGVLAFKWMAGITPYEGSGLHNLLIAKVEKEPIDLRRVVPTLPSGIATLIMRLLERDPERRPQTALDLVKQLNRARDELSIGVLSGRVTSAPRSRPAGRLSFLLLLAVIALLCTAIGVMVTGTWRPLLKQIEAIWADPHAAVGDAGRELTKWRLVK